MLMHPLPKHKPTLWESVKAIFSQKTKTPPPVSEQGKKLPKEAESSERKGTVFPGPGDF